ncbi:MAG: beta-lactamase family protein [Rhodanobacteraceae bacterium]|nr:beta-lactamase family protein [Rhodanobacteraceae bacterium]
MRWMFGCWVALLLAAGACPAQAVDYTEVTRRMQAVVTEQALPGASLLVIRHGRVEYQQAFGGYTLERRVPIASASKWLSGAVLARLVERGVMHWDDPIARWLPSAPADKRAITLRQLFSHTSGLPAFEASCLVDAQAALQACVDEILAQPLRYPPGTGFAYGGNSMQVAGRLAEIASGRRWDDLFREEVATPLGMVATDYAFSSTQPGYVETCNPRIAGGARSTLADYGRFVQAVLERGVVDGRVWLSAGMIDQMAEDQTRGAPVISTPLPSARGYGIGQWRERVDAAGRASFLSSPGAFGFYPAVDRSAQYAAVFLTFDQFEDVYFPLQGILGELGRLYAAAPVDPPRLLVAGGYGGGLLAPGSARDAFAEAPGSARMFVRWHGDTALLRDPRAWHAPLTMPARGASLAAEFTPVPALPALVEGTANGARWRALLPPAPRGLVLSFHGSGGSGDLPFSKPEAQVATRLLYQRGFGVVGLDSSDRVARQWNPQFSLSNPDIVNVQALLAQLRAAGAIAADTPVYCEGTSNGGGFCSRASALLGMRGQSLMIADGNEAVLAQASVPTIWTLGRNDPTLAPGYLDRAAASAAGFAARGVPQELNIVEPSPVYPERFARVDGVSVDQSRALTESLRSTGFLDAAGYVIRDPRGDAIDALVPASLRSVQGYLVAELEIAHAAHEYYSDHAHRIVHFFEAQLAPNLTGLWWKPDEPGWGISLAQQDGRLFPVWYTYDAQGRPAWYVGGLLEPQTDGSYSGPLYASRGVRFDAILGEAGLGTSEVGRIAVRARSDGGLDLSTTLGGVVQSRRIERTRFGRLPACRARDGSRADGANRSDIWWNPRQPGWGVQLTEQDATLVLSWYTYAADGAPMWVLGALTRPADGSFAGPLTRPVSGTAFSGIAGPATSFPVPTVGEARIEFLDGERGVFRYTLDGISQSREIERLRWATAGYSDCQ